MFLNNTTTYTELEEAINRSDLTSNSTYHVEDGNRDSLYVIIPMTLFYTIIFLSGVVGNVSTCIVIFYCKYMHTATNFYLFSLAVSDLLLLLSALPKEVYELWFRCSYIFGEVSCILQGFASESATNATVLTITAFTIERYVAICHPFMSHTVSKLSRAIKHIIIIWLLALCLAIPQAVQFGLVYKSDQNIECTVIPSFMDHAFEISSLVFFVIPMCVISALYILIGFRLRRSRLMKQISPGNFRTVERHLTKNQGRVIRMLVAVVVAFIICWAPFHAQRLVAIYGLRSKEPSNTVLAIYNVLTYISGILYYLSATINPILYNIMSHRFRRAFKLTFAHLCTCCISQQQRNKHLTRNRSYYATRMNRNQQSTPRSSLSQKGDIPMQRQRSHNGFAINKAAVRDGSIPSSEKTNVSLLPDNASDNNNKPVKKDRSPIVAIKAKLQAMKPSSSQTKSSQHQYHSMDDLYESKFTEMELLTHSEQFDRKLLL